MSEFNSSTRILIWLLRELSILSISEFKSETWELILLNNDDSSEVIPELILLSNWSPSASLLLITLLIELIDLSISLIIEFIELLVISGS